jgi:hypothetical protein
MFISEGQITMVWRHGRGGQDDRARRDAGRASPAAPRWRSAPATCSHPGKVPHQMKLAAGAKVTYFVTKVVQ